MHRVNTLQEEEEEEEEEEKNVFKILKGALSAKIVNFCYS